MATMAIEEVHLGMLSGITYMNPPRQMAKRRNVPAGELNCVQEATWSTI